MEVLGSGYAVLRPAASPGRRVPSTRGRRVLRSTQRFSSDRERSGMSAQPGEVWGCKH